MVVSGGLLCVFWIPDKGFFASKLDEEGNGIVCLLADGLLLSALLSAADPPQPSLNTNLGTSSSGCAATLHQLTVY